MSCFCAYVTSGVCVRVRNSGGEGLRCGYKRRVFVTCNGGFWAGVCVVCEMVVMLCFLP